MKVLVLLCGTLLCGQAFASGKPVCSERQLKNGCVVKEDPNDCWDTYKEDGSYNSTICRDFCDCNNAIYPSTKALFKTWKMKDKVIF